MPFVPVLGCAFLVSGHFLEGLQWPKNIFGHLRNNSRLRREVGKILGGFRKDKLDFERRDGKLRDSVGHHEMPEILFITHHALIEAQESVNLSLISEDNYHDDSTKNSQNLHNDRMCTHV